MVLYVPVLHQGYINFFQRWRYDVEEVYIFGSQLTTDLVYLEKEIRALDPAMMASLILATGFFKEVKVLDLAGIDRLRGNIVITADESISRRLVEKYLADEKVVFESVFLRWDERHVTSQEAVVYDRISLDPFDREMMALARQEGEKSSDWWRKVGAVLISETGTILEAHNQHLPSDHSPYVHGDIRDFVKPGENSDVSSSVHAEKSVIAIAANRGVALKGASIYVSVFPCSGCAQMVALSGITRCFYGSGCANFNGQKLFKFFKVEIILVK